MSGFEQLPDGVYRWMQVMILQSTFPVPRGWEWYEFETGDWLTRHARFDCPVRVRPVGVTE